MLIKSEEEIDVIREGGKLLSHIVAELEDVLAVGISTGELDVLAEKKIREAGGVPAFKGYRGSSSDPPFPGTICASLNDEVVHGIPRKDRVLKEGDLFKLDIGMRYKNLFTDMARTFAVGKISREARTLLDVTRQSLEAGVETIREGSTIREYARAVEQYVKPFGFGVVRDLVGHGVGHEVHEAPQIPNAVDARMPEFVFRKGMVIALEPMINRGTWKIRLLDDQWTFATADGELSAHWENTYVVRENEAEQLT